MGAGICCIDPGKEAMQIEEWSQSPEIADEIT
jgi:hypothetical protein